MAPWILSESPLLLYKRNNTTEIPVFTPFIVIENDAPTKIKIPYDMALDETSIPDVSAYVLGSGKTVTLVEVTGLYVYLTASTRYYWGDTETVAYTAPATNMIKSTGGGEAASFTATAVTNNIELDSRASTLITSYGTVPTTATKALINKTIVDLKAIGTFAKRDVIVLPVHTSNDSLLNLVSASFTGTLMNAPTFTPGYGWALNGTTQYLKSNFIPSTAGGQGTLDSASFTIIFNTNTVKADYEISGSFSLSTKRTQLLRPNGYYEYYGGGLNSGIALTASTDRLTGIYTLTRTASNILKMFVNKILKHDVATASTAITDREIYVGSMNNAGTATFFENDSIAGYALGGGLTQTEVEQETDILQYFRDNIIATL